MGESKLDRFAVKYLFTKSRRLMLSLCIFWSKIKFDKCSIYDCVCIIRSNKVQLLACLNRLGHTISIMRVGYHQLFAGACRTLESSQRLPHQLHLHLHGVQRSKHLLHSLGIFQRRISLQEVIHVQLNLRFLLLFCAGSSSGPVRVLPTSLTSLSDGHRFEHGGWRTLTAARMRSERSLKEG